MAEAGPEPEGGDPGSAGVGAVRNLHATRAAGLSEGERSESCKDLAKMLRDRKCHKWSVINSQGQVYLLQDSRIEKAEVPEDKWDHMGSYGFVPRAPIKCKESLNRDQASPELQSLSENEEPSTSQVNEEDILLGVIPEMRQPDYLRPKQSLGNDSVPD